MSTRFWATCLSQLIFVIASAQEQVATTRTSHHYVGLQANQLIRQIFNFGGGSAGVASNPYFLTYSVNSRETGTGFNFGFGYTYNQTKDGDQFVDRTTTVNDLFLRAGLEKKSVLVPKVIVSIGGDIVADFLKTSTKTDENSQTQFNFESGTRSNGVGLGPRLTLNYEISQKILIGTEANYYFKSFNIKEYQKNVFFESQFDPSTGQFRQVRREDEQSEEEKQKRFQFNSPAVIYIIMKL